MGQGPWGASHSSGVLETHPMVLSETGLPKVKVSSVYSDSILFQLIEAHSTAWTFCCLDS